VNNDDMKAMIPHGILTGFSTSTVPTGDNKSQSSDIKRRDLGFNSLVLHTVGT
jgi:hypothetical protein